MKRSHISHILILALILFTTGLSPFAVAQSAPVQAVSASPDDFSCDNVTEIPTVECEALVALYNSANGPGWINKTGWLETNTPCSWFGVTCEAGHVSALGLTRNQLSGGIPSQLSDFASMRFLNLGLNALTGPLPPQLGNLHNLEWMNLHGNMLTGSIPPEFEALSKLWRLSLYDNQLTGSIPAELGNLISLRFLSLGNNRLTGTIPIELANLSGLNELILNHNQLSGVVPPWLSSLTKLRALILSDNQLTGTVPVSLSTLLSLENLQIGGNPVNGPLPTELAELGLDFFWFDKTDLCEPGDSTFQAWLDSISDLRRTEVICGTQTVNGTVWDDRNRDGIQDAVEPPLPGLMVTLTANAGSLLSIAAGRQVMTGDDGGYRFGFVSPGAYTIAVTGPGGYLPTVPGPVDVTVPAEGDVTVPPIGLAEAPVHVWLPLIRR